MRPFILREAIASTALSHPAGCDCRVCRAADGDGAAFAEVWEAVAAEQDRRAENDEGPP